MMMGIWFVCMSPFICWQNSRPFIWGIMISQIMMSTGVFLSNSSPCKAFSAMKIWYFLLRICCMSSRKSLLSSMNKIQGFSSGMNVSVSSSWTVRREDSAISRSLYTSLSIGISTVKTEPLPGSLLTSIVPWCRVTSSLVNDRPIPFDWHPGWFLLL